MQKFNVNWEFAKRNLFTILLILAILLLIFQNMGTKSEFSQLKATMLEQDSLRKVSEGQYAKLVDDMETRKSIMKELEKSNKELHDYLKDNGKKPIIHTYTEIRYIEKPDTTDIRKDRTFDLFYPNKEENLINYSGLITDSQIFGKWNFNPITLDLVISEKTPGLYEADLMGNKWVKVESLEVKSLPLDPLQPDNFDWKVGLGYWQEIDAFGLDVYGGVRIKRVDALMRVQPRGIRSQVGGALLYNF